MLGLYRNIKGMRLIDDLITEQIIGFWLKANLLLGIKAANQHTGLYGFWVQRLTVLIGI